MRVAREILDSVEIAESDLGGFQPRGDDLTRMPGEFCGDARIDFGAVCDAPVVVAKARIVGQCGVAEDYPVCVEVCVLMGGPTPDTLCPEGRGLSHNAPVNRCVGGAPDCRWASK